uniref:Bm10179 n=1 Tax=Brugia malayi TaxID=6279 RepID=A0A0J9YAX8_BRUMA|nr:Bm10179 [Brugia malayi]
MCAHGPYEEQEIEKRFNELRKYVWRRIDPARRLGILRGRARGFGRRAGYAVVVTVHQVLVSHRQFAINPAV